MRTRNLGHDQPGMALVVVLMVLLAASAVAAGAAMVGSNGWIIHQYSDRQSVLESVADAGLEEARAALNGQPDLFPDSGYVVLESKTDVRDAEGQVISGIERTTYVGPTGTMTGQYGTFGSIVVVAGDGRNRVIRRAEVTEESFAKYAYFTDMETLPTGEAINFGSDDQLAGPVHSNDVITIYAQSPVFRGRVTTAQTVTNRSYGDFRQGLDERVARIEMPNTADLDRLRGYATEGGMNFVSSTSGGRSQATMRIEFVTINGYGFIKVYKARGANNGANNAFWVTATVPSDYNTRGMQNSPNCGHYHTTGSGGRRGNPGQQQFVAAADHPTGGRDDWQQAITDDGRCFLGGSDSIFGEFRSSDTRGEWLPRPDGSTHLARDAGRPDSAYLFPINREMNPNFKGVIHVTGKVAVSGTVRGQITLVATDDIIIADELKYAIDPGNPARNCLDGDDSTHDILGLFSGSDIIVADNTLNSPVRPKQNQGRYISLSATPYVTIHSTLLALDAFTVDNYDGGSEDALSCGGSYSGRGCLYVEGGIIQRTRGPVGMTNGLGFTKRYSYDECVLSNPPPYFPTTGNFSGGRYYEIDPTGFDVDQLFEQLTAY